MHFVKRLFLFLFIATIFSGCSATPTEELQSPPPTTPPPVKAPKKPVATPKIESEPESGPIAKMAITNEEELVRGLGPTGAILCYTVSDMEVIKDLVMEGDFEVADNKDPNQAKRVGRQLDLYAQDSRGIKIAAFKLKAPRFTVKSKNTTIRGGTFVGDIYVEATGFTLEEANVEGNIYFATLSAKTSFQMKKNSTVSGLKTIKKASYF